MEMNEKTVDTLKCLLDMGFKITQIAEKMQLTPNKIYTMIKKNEIDYVRQRAEKASVPNTKKLVETIKKYAADGLTSKQIAEKANIPLAKFYNISHNYDIDYVKNPKFCRDTTKTIINICNALHMGKTPTAIANDLGVSRTSVYDLIRRHEIPMPKKAR